MTIKDALNLGYKKTKSTLDSEVLLSHILDKSKEFIFTHPEKQLNTKQEQQFKIFLSRRKLGWPVAYLTGEKEFYGLKFKVNNQVLIPRPETELLVDEIKKYIHEYILSKKVKILDVGTGSGAIIISLAKTLGTKHQYSASDISSQALRIAKTNAKLHKVKISFKQGSLLSPWKKSAFDIVAANLPYLAKLEHPSTKFEPRKALLAKKQGLALYEKLFQQISLVTYIPAVFIEFDPRQTRLIKNLAHKYLPGFESVIYKDLSGHERVIVLFPS